MHTHTHTDTFGIYYFYLVNGEKVFHRDDGPAIERSNGDKFWFQHNKYHREDGPAVEYADGEKRYYYQDESFQNIKTNEQWKKHLKWMKFQ